MSQNYHHYQSIGTNTTHSCAPPLQSLPAYLISQSTNTSQSFSVASALLGGGGGGNGLGGLGGLGFGSVFNPRIISNYGGYETYQYGSSTGNATSSPVFAIASSTPAATGAPTAAAPIGVSSLISGSGAVYEQRQVQTGGCADSTTMGGDYVFKSSNDYNYGVSTNNNKNNNNNNNNNNQNLSQQIATDLMQLNRISSSHGFGNNHQLSAVEAAILRSSVPIEIAETEEITVNGQRGIWANKTEVTNWRGVIPITDYEINQDAQPELITKRSNQQLVYQQEVAIRYLRPPTPPPPGEIIIQQEMNTVTPPAPPLIIRQQPPRPITPQPLVVREAPPPPPAQVGKKVITISGKRIPPPPRKVVIERLAPLPSKPQSVIIERWLPYSQVKRRVIFQKACSSSDPVVVKPRNVIIQWESPQVTIKKEFKDLGVIRANPAEYVARYGSSLKNARELPPFVLEIKPPAGVVLAADQPYSASNQVYELEGDVQALRLVDLDREGLSEYKHLLGRLGTGAAPVNTVHVPTVLPPPPPPPPPTTNTPQERTQQPPPQSLPQPQSIQYETISITNANQTVPVSVASPNNQYLNGTTASSLQAAGVPPQPVTGAAINEIFASVERDHPDGRGIKTEEAEKLLLRLHSRLARRCGEDEVRRFIDSLDVTKDGLVDLLDFRRAFDAQL